MCERFLERNFIPQSGHFYKEKKMKHVSTHVLNLTINLKTFELQANFSQGLPKNVNFPLIWNHQAKDSLVMQTGVPKGKNRSSLLTYPPAHAWYDHQSWLITPITFFPSFSNPDISHINKLQCNIIMHLPVLKWEYRL